MRRLALLITTLLVCSGCVRRTLSITSEPAGALVWLNDREIGRTPVDTEFLHYGTYDVRLVLDGYEPLLTVGEAKAPWWDTVGLDLFAELAPGEPHADIRWHYTLGPELNDPEALVERARELRDRAPGESSADAVDGEQADAAASTDATGDAG